MNDETLHGLTAQDIYGLAKFHEVNENVMQAVYDEIYLMLCERNSLAACVEI